MAIAFACTGKGKTMCGTGRAWTTGREQAVTAIDSTQDIGAIRAVVENWAVWRDAGDWERFATVWHRDGYMTATWFQGPAREFIKATRDGFASGVRILHFLGGSSVDVSGDRAIAQTKMTISQRAAIHDVDVDVVCTGRFYDFFSRDDERWTIVRRQPIYEKDRVDPLEPNATLTLDQRRLESFPEGYRHLAYLQLETGFDVENGLPGLTGPAVEQLYREGAQWLAGAATTGRPPDHPDRVGDAAVLKMTGGRENLPAR